MPMSRARQTQSEIHDYAKVPHFFPKASSAMQAQSSRSSSPVRPMVSIPMERGSSCDHPPSPIGPRPQRPRPTSSPMHEKVPGLPFQPMSPPSQRPQPQRSSSSRPSWMPPPTSAGPSSFSSAVPSAIHAPAPRQATEPKILPMITAPRVGDADLQKAIDQYANIVNEQANNWNTTYAHIFQPQPGASAHRGRSHTSVRGGEANSRLDFTSRYAAVKSDKENANQAPSVRRHAQDGVVATQGGLGFGSSVPMPMAPMSKEMSNVMAANAQDGKAAKKTRGKLLYC